MRQKCNENAANRYSYIGDVYRTGEVQRKKETLYAMPKEWSDLHRKGYIHIHDLDAHGLTYNCLTFNIRKDFPYRSRSNVSVEIAFTIVQISKRFAFRSAFKLWEITLLPVARN